MMNEATSLDELVVVRVPVLRIGARTDSWVAGIVDALQAPALRVQAAPLVPPLLQAGGAPTGGAEAVAAVPGQDGAGLGHHASGQNRNTISVKGQLGRTEQVTGLESSSPASSSSSLRRSRFGVFGKKQPLSSQRFSNSAASSSALMANQTGVSGVPGSI